ncbi:hypothetical protein WNY81_08730 [Shewanella frigidimarina]|uniref:hypothetical protein n=1 Tax=Shewanella frigidimarina TaxID=56812 RepID=UPI00316C5258
MLKQLQQSLSAPRTIMTINAVNTDGTVTASTASNHTQGSSVLAALVITSTFKTAGC